MNKQTCIGNLTADPQRRELGDGKVVCNFTVAVNRRKKVQGQPDADFFRVDAWDKLADLCMKYLAKGKKVCVVGPVSVHTYKGNDGETKATLELHADDVEFLSPAGSNGQEETAPADTAQDPSGGTVVDSEELPF